MDNRSEVREFLTSRRGKITPEQAGVPQVGQRRGPGLRRSEVAALAGTSVEYYAKLERGSLGGVSASVLDAIARALQLDEAERTHLFNLAHAADGTSAAMRPRRRSRDRDVDVVRRGQLSRRTAQGARYQVAWHSVQCFAKRRIGVVASTTAEMNRADGVPRIGSALDRVQLTVAFEIELAREFAERHVLIAARRQHEAVQQVQAHGFEPSAFGTLRVLR